jgi:hypothetical protein
MQTTLKYLIVVVGFALCRPLAGQQPPAALNMGPNDLSAALVGVRVVAGLPASPRLPVMLEITVSNPTNRDIVLPVPTFSDRDNPWNTLDLFYTRNGVSRTRVSNLVPVFGPWKEGLEPPLPALMKFIPGQRWTARVPLSYDWLSGEPNPIIEAGSLRVDARLCAVTRDARGSLNLDRNRGKDSLPLTISVASAGGANALALEDLAKAFEPWAVAAPESGDYLSAPQRLEFFEAFAARHPRSVYTPYAQALLAHLYVNGYKMAKASAVPADLARAAVLIGEAASSPLFALTADADELKSKVQALRAKQ